MAYTIPQIREIAKQDRLATDTTYTTLETFLNDPTNPDNATQALKALQDIHPRYSDPQKVEAIERFTDAGEFTTGIATEVAGLVGILTKNLPDAEANLKRIQLLQKIIGGYVSEASAIIAKGEKSDTLQADINALYSELQRFGSKIQIERKGKKVEPENYGNAIEDLDHATSAVGAGRVSKALERVRSAAVYLLTLGENDIPKELMRYAEGDLEAIKRQALPLAARLNPRLDAMSDIYTKLEKATRRYLSAEGVPAEEATPAPSPTPPAPIPPTITPEPPVITPAATPMGPSITPPAEEPKTIPITEPAKEGDDLAAKDSGLFRSSLPAPYTRF